MTKLQKRILITVGVLAIPISILAMGHDKFEHYERDGVKGCYEKKMYKHRGAKMMREKGANYFFEGDINELPKNGFNGMWKIGDKQIVVNDETMIVEDDDGKVSTNNEAKVVAKRIDNQIIALKIIVDD